MFTDILSVNHQEHTDRTWLHCFKKVNPIPSSCFLKCISKSVAESSELFSKDSRLSFSSSTETKDIICILKFELVVQCNCNQAVHLEPSTSHHSCGRIQQENTKLFQLQILPFKYLFRPDQFNFREHRFFSKFEGSVGREKKGK